MFDVVLYEPEIPPNTGNIIRLCANTGCKLHLIEPLGFEMDDKQLRRAGLDYREIAEVKTHTNLESYLANSEPKRVFAVSTKGSSRFDLNSYQNGDAFLFGPETRGLPDEVRAKFNVIRIPMLPESRSLNLSNAVSVVVYEALRQSGFEAID